MVIADCFREELKEIIKAKSKFKKGANLELELTGVLTIFDILATIKDYPRKIGDSIDTSHLRKVGEVAVGTYSPKNLKGQKNDINVVIKKIYDSEGRFLREYSSKDTYLSGEELITTGKQLGVALGGPLREHHSEWAGFIMREEPTYSKQYVSK